jgi:hypothetical protein
MSSADAGKIVMVFGPIIGLLVLGSWVSIRSGVVEVASWQGVVRMARNFSQAVALIALCLVVLAVVQQLVGHRPVLLW